MFSDGPETRGWTKQLSWVKAVTPVAEGDGCQELSERLRNSCVPRGGLSSPQTLAGKTESCTLYESLSPFRRETNAAIPAAPPLPAARRASCRGLAPSAVQPPRPRKVAAVRIARRPRPGEATWSGRGGSGLAGDRTGVRRRGSALSDLEPRSEVRRKGRNDRNRIPGSAPREARSSCRYRNHLPDGSVPSADSPAVVVHPGPPGRSPAWHPFKPAGVPQDASDTARRAVLAFAVATVPSAPSGRSLAVARKSCPGSG